VSWFSASRVVGSSSAQTCVEAQCFDDQGLILDEHFGTLGETSAGIAGSM
jgi:hypothetical protein